MLSLSHYSLASKTSATISKANFLTILRTLGNVWNSLFSLRSKCLSSTSRRIRDSIKHTYSVQTVSPMASRTPSNFSGMLYFSDARSAGCGSVSGLDAVLSGSRLGSLIACVGLRGVGVSTLHLVRLELLFICLAEICKLLSLTALSHLASSSSLPQSEGQP